MDPDKSIRLAYKASNQKASNLLYEKLKSMLSSLGMHQHLINRSLYMKNDVGVAGVAHQSGTCRFGFDPKTSVLDLNCKAHELDNLYVVDTSFFPSIGAVNPALTAMANALRVGDHLLETVEVTSPLPWRNARKSPLSTRRRSFRGSRSSPFPQSARS